MLTQKRAIDIATAFKNDACSFMDINPDDIHINTIVSIPSIMVGGFPVPQNAKVDPEVETTCLM